VFAPGMGGVLAFCFAAFMGFESTVLYREEARDPERTIPRATYIAVGFMAIFYCFIVWSAIQAFGSDKAVEAAGGNIAEMFFIIIATYVGPWASVLMHLLVISSVYASQIAFHNAITRYTYALAEDGVLPAWIGRVSPRFGSPYRAGIAQTALAVLVIAVFAIVGADPYTGLLLWVNTPGVVGTLLLQTLVAVAIVVYFTRRNPQASSPRALAAGIGSALLLAAATVVLVENVDLLTNASAATNVLLWASCPRRCWWASRSPRGCAPGDPRPTPASARATPRPPGPRSGAPRERRPRGVRRHRAHLLRHR
jgi:amino acid transporter